MRKLLANLIHFAAAVLNTLCVLGLALIVAKGPSVTMWMQ